MNAAVKLFRSMPAAGSRLVAAHLLALACMASHAQTPFEVGIAPSRFELSGKSSQRIGQTLDIFGLGATASEVSIRTIDWSFSPEGHLAYFDELRPDSCRPWVTLERRTVKIAARSKTSFRFQIDVPADAARGECRFMLAVEGLEPAHKALIESGGASLSLPVTGRIAIAVYVSINGAEPKLEMTQVGTRDIQGRRTPVVTVVNRGDAHGRLDGTVEARDGKGQSFELAPEGTPILPGQTRTLSLAATADGNKPPPAISYPLEIKGTLDWEKGGFKVNAQLP